MMKVVENDHMEDPRQIMTDFNQHSCAKCISGKPCEYPDTVDLRIIVLAYNRDHSLLNCLHNFYNIVTDGDKVAIEIWIDLSKEGKVHLPTLEVAQQFASTWHLGQACVHVQTDHANIGGQWMYSWRPKQDSGELGLIVEDDVDVSSYAYMYQFCYYFVVIYTAVLEIFCKDLFCLIDLILG